MARGSQSASGEQRDMEDAASFGESGVESEAPAAAPAYVDRVSEGIVACPECWLLAPVLAVPPGESYPHVRCARGHDTAIIPVLHEHMRSLLAAVSS